MFAVKVGDMYVEAGYIYIYLCRRRMFLVVGCEFFV